MNGANSVAEAMSEIRREYGDVIYLKLYYVDDIRKGIEDVSSLIDADIVWLDIRNDIPAVKLIKEVLSSSANVVIGYSMGNIFGIGPVWLEREQSPTQQRIIGWMRGRMEEMAGRNDKNFDMSKMRGMMKMAGVAGKLPSRFFKEVSRRTTAMEYWQYGGKENTKNLLLYLAKEYGGKRSPQSRHRSIPNPAYITLSSKRPSLH